ncbi:3'-5' exonuclease [Roseomonas aerophila]|uniref:3'-5' exonuclease n=1 Tax=Teichococcus aerophilus TaxID=1224513 RepID=A0ABR7RQU1_9PROT|nr:DUF6429 family protein [Pseudoroseomonas aerophila]MBC9208969.1 3'-5' exonuclease [Pseudoroseomonas aerophila]
MTSPREIFVSVDVETAGPIPGEYSLLSIGACSAFDPDNGFTVEVKPINDRFDPKALEVTGLSMDELRQRGLDPEAAMKVFSDWLAILAGPDDTLVFVGFNAPFDWSFVNYYFHRFAGQNPFGFTALDIKALYMGATGSSWRDTRSSKIAEHLKPTLAGTHDPLEDARYQAEIFRLIDTALIPSRGLADQRSAGDRIEADKDKIDDAVLALLFLSLDHDGRAWKGFDWDAMNRLHEKGYIGNPVGKAKSVVLTEDGVKRSEILFRKLFARTC